MELVLCPWTLTGGAFGSVKITVIFVLHKIRTPNSTVKFVLHEIVCVQVIFFVTRDTPHCLRKENKTNVQNLSCTIFVFFVLLLMDLFITNKKSPFSILLLSIVSSLTTYCPRL